MKKAIKYKILLKILVKKAASEKAKINGGHTFIPVKNPKIKPLNIK